ncbi:MSP domain-containing protein [Cryptococcus neoformans var. grubii Br795]|uniref:MSP domain-containing protein n=1 Tax=Cryptococcus neoformans Tu259-1 TaxID=1230072 RepID=A0A854QHA6_CRYNE|nr:MSP domain-containing protein [Cryptococcus neoformans var. grubii AD1-83a]OWZ56135.1 MSP domain-containing protein [Cryptococcus neoformans var. grubii 125.91]OXG24989.1 MSP domain-containing protein [Cryptococcus neoformans var. grubii Tu259-1]OXG44045.1 MSP domain-containing protein [Cryptococcus neoformans var. grubii Bt120]OXG48170.1 MSP domain-containing protein [Cryptococcus neoformans var. grubii MW-RSA1955]OXG51826.1 MSP domain-containing protein [Cryptococcus neoformans var. grubi
MSIELNPATQLGFPRPFTNVVKRSLLIHNPNYHPVAFKVKTTAPKQYSVRPNSGRVEAGESVEVHIMLQPLAQEPPPHAKCKDKFLVQSAFITPDEEMHSLAELWSQLEKTNKGAISEQKLKVVYLPAEDGSTNNQGIPEEEEVGEASRVEEPAIFSHAQTSPSHEKPFSPLEQPKSVDITAPALAPTQPPLPSLTPTAVNATNSALEQSLAATTSDSEKLAVALKEIESLRAQLEEAKGPQVSGLRKRGTAGGANEPANKPAQAVATAQQQGVPLEIVIGLMVGVFVLTYLFF